MAILYKSLPVQNCSVLVRDSQHDEPLFIERHDLIASGAYGLNISCMPDSDGETLIIAGPKTEVQSDDSPVFNGIIGTPSRMIRVETILRTTIFEIDVESDVTRLSVWTDGHAATERITIGIG
jgi:hypothetical protein